MSEQSGLREYLAGRDVPCPKCGYNLRGLSEPVCPECGWGIRLEVVTEGRWNEPTWLSAASSPIGMAVTLAMGLGLVWVDRAAAAIVLVWVSVMAFACYWRWTRPLIAREGLTEETRRRRGFLVTLGGLAMIAGVFVVVMLLVKGSG